MYRYDKYPDIPADLKPVTVGDLVAATPQPARLGKSN
jgi:hypothetical protein